MAIPRPALLGIVGAILIAAVFLMTRSSGEESAEPPVSAPASVAPEAPAAAPAGSPAADQATAGGGARPPGPAGADSPETTQPPVVTLPVARALGRERILVLLFTQGGAADDKATRHEVAQLRRYVSDSPRLRKRVAFVTDRIGNVGDYRGVIGSLGVAQAPSIVIVGRDLDARLLEGFTDYRSLRQYVADARG